MVTELAPLEIGNLKMIPAKFSALWKGKTIALTKKQFLLVYFMAKKPGYVYNRNQIMDFAWGEDTFVMDRSVDSIVKKARRAFEAIDPSFDCLVAHYGIGYVWRE